jgi:hypothetical protein
MGADIFAESSFQRSFFGGAWDDYGYNVASDSTCCRRRGATDRTRVGS